MSKPELKPCPFCGGAKIVIETWLSGGWMHMIKCNNPDCPVPANGYPTGRDLEKVRQEWNRRAGNE